MPQVPNNFLFTAEQQIASYDWQDFAAGAGIIRYYCAASETTGPAYSYFLTRREIDGTVNKRTISASTGSSTEVNFDIVYNNTAFIRGDAVVNYTIESQTNTVEYTTFRLLRVRDAVETVIASATGASHTNSSGSTQYYRYAIKMSCTETSIARGDTLRLEVVIFNTGAANLDILHFDPSSSQTLTETATGRTIGTDLFIEIPFKIDL